MLYESSTYRLEADDQVLTLWIDFRGRPNHTLTLAAINELSLILERIASLPTSGVLIIRSGRPGTFLEEFDSAELARFSSPLEFAALARRGQEVARKLEQLSAPTVALIEGRCAGAGLELALACAYRVATDGSRTQFTLNEVDRGLVPACGGTYRLPRIVGTSAATRMIVNGSVVSAETAERIGLVHRVIPASQVAVQISAILDALRDGRPNIGRGILRRVSRSMKSVISVATSRPLLPKADALACPKFAAQHAITAGLSSEGEGLAAERAALTRLCATDQTRNLLDLNRRAAAPIRVVPEPMNPTPPAPRRIGIVGGGAWGTLLSCWFARRGVDVVIQERDAEAAEQTSRRVAARLADMAGRGDITRRESQAIGPRVQTTAEWVGFDEADFVIEAADEDVGVKRNLHNEVERRVRPRVILATASTTVTVESIQSELVRPGRVAGLHLPNLQDRHPVAEIVGTPQTDPATIAALGRWVREWGFIPVRVADRPGRLVEFVRMTYLSEGVHLVAEGLPIDWIDEGLLRFGMARGPLEWCDDIGLDRLAELAAQMQLARGDGFARNLLFQRLVPYGCVGKSVAEGFYRYGWRQRPSQVARMALWQDLDEDATAPYLFDPKETIREGIERVLLRTVNAAAAALTEEPDSDPGTVDLALAFGMGWTPARGGPLRYADSMSLGSVAERLAHFAERFGPRFTPCDELLRRAEAGETFYGSSAELAIPSIPWRLAG